jgi:hypothetical protein
MGMSCVSANLHSRFVNRAFETKSCANIENNSLSFNDKVHNVSYNRSELWREASFIFRQMVDHY